MISGRSASAAGLFLIACVLGFSLYTFFAGPLIPYLRDKQTDAVRGAVQRGLSTGNNIMYATVLSVDAQRGVLKISAPPRISSSASPITLSLQIFNDAYIARQTRMHDGATVYGLSQERVASLADIRPGDHAAVMVLRDAEGRFFSPYVIYGDPL
jgi:hypothetical protein